MKYVDIIGQTAILIFTLVMIAAYSWSGLMYGQLFIGIWQMISSLVSIIGKAPFQNLRKIHFILALTYLLLMFIGVSNHAFAFLTIPAWMLALYYYTITWKWVLVDPKRGKFLPNISF